MRGHSTPLTAQDAGYLRRETAAQPMHFVLASRTAPDHRGITVDAVRESVERRIDSLPVLRSRLIDPPFGIGPARWVDDPDFSLRNQVTAWGSSADGPGPWDWPGRLARMTEIRLERDQPLWTIRVVTSDDDQEAGVLFAAHHALMDGGLLKNVLDELFPAAADDNARATSTGGIWRPRRAPSRAELLASGLTGAVRHRVEAARPGRREGARPAVDERPPELPGRLTGTVSAGRRIGTITVPLPTLKATSRRLGAKVNDLFLAAVTHGLQFLLQERQDVTGGAIHALVPRDVRTAADAVSTGNRTTGMRIALAVDATGLPEILDRTRHATEAAKSSSPAGILAESTYDVTVSNVNLGGPHLVAGIPLSQHHATAPLQGTNRLVIIGTSSHEHFGVTVTADAEAFPDTDVLLSGISDAFDQLQEL